LEERAAVARVSLAEADLGLTAAEDLEEGLGLVVGVFFFVVVAIGGKGYRGLRGERKSQDEARRRGLLTR
jgi:hypothetical protein